MPSCGRVLCSQYLGRFSLFTGARVTSLLMGIVFLFCGLGGLLLIALWGSLLDSLENYLGTNPDTGHNEMLDAFYPTLLAIAVAAFLVYSISGFLSLLGLSRGLKWPQQVFLVASIVVIALCLIGHVYMFVFLPWYKPNLLIITVTFNALWYIVWIYSTLVLFSYVNSEEILSIPDNH